VDDQKLSQYAQGTVRKSKREKEKEAAEAKRKEEEEQAAKAYAEFLDAFDADDHNNARRAGSRAASCALQEILVLHTHHQGHLDHTRNPVPCEHLNSPKYVTPYIYCMSGHAYMTAVSVSSCDAQAERKTCHGCLLRGD
jgi:putative alpha-1,2-mannosidase